MLITNDIIWDYLNCQYKIVQYSRETTVSNYLEKITSVIKRKAYLRFLSEQGSELEVCTVNADLDALKPISIGSKNRIITISITGIEIDVQIPVVELNHSTKGDHRAYFFMLRDKVGRIEHEFCTILLAILCKYTGIRVERFSVIFGAGLINKVTRKNTQIADLTILDHIKNRENDKSLGPNLCAYCRICKYEQACRKELVEVDSLSLLARISNKEISKLNKKGIFTVNQLSYTFRQRKSRFRTKTKGRYRYELKALAIRERKTYVLNRRKLITGRCEIFIDFEGDLNYNVYLIGMLVYESGKEQQKIFWSSDENDESIFFSFFNYIRLLEGDFQIYCFGSYELRAIKKFLRKNGDDDFDLFELLQQNTTNILEFFYGDVFVPTYSNSLKEIANYLGFSWSRKNCNAILAKFWREQWLITNDEKLRRKLIIYNLEDCYALVVVKDWLVKLFQSNNDGSTEEVFDLTQRNYPSASRKYQKNTFVLDVYEEVNSLAYFDYQNKKVYSRDKEFKKRYNPKRHKFKVKNRINRKIDGKIPDFCPNCASTQLKVHQNHYRVIVDLRISPTGIKKESTQFNARRIRCKSCLFTFTPAEYKGQSKFGDNLKIWVVNQVITYKMSYGDVQKSLFDYYQIMISTSLLAQMRGEVARKYRDFFEDIKSDLKRCNLIHADETKVRLRSEDGYIWVFTSLSTVAYFYEPSRDGKFLRKFLSDFKGVLVSDFYAAYDSIDCPQQRCLIHLMRDINDDLFREQFNLELNELGNLFGELLKSIVNTVDQYGLKRRYLRKHQKQAIRFYKQVEELSLKTETGIKWQRRIIKNKGRLFTFLQYDGIPWNNNNAERAVKSFAVHRRSLNGFYSNKGIDEFLILLSISETCRFRNMSFWELLKSGELRLN